MYKYKWDLLKSACGFSGKCFVKDHRPPLLGKAIGAWCKLMDNVHWVKNDGQCILGKGKNEWLKQIDSRDFWQIPEKNWWKTCKIDFLTHT